MRLRTRLLTSAAVAGSLVLPLVPGAPAGAAPDDVTTPVDEAIAWLTTQQEADGGFEVADSGGFETPDAILAIAAAGQAGETWNEEDALAAVESITTGGKDALDAVDDWVDTVQADGTATAGTKAQQAAKVIALVTEPLGLDETDFDPSGDTEAAVDLVATIEAAEGDGSFMGVTVTGKAYVVWALAALGEEVPAGLFTALASAQQANGGFNYVGDPAWTSFDPDITATVATALAVAGKTPATDATLRKALSGLAIQQRWNGEWAGEFDDGNPNSTAVVLTMVSALCGDDVGGAWRSYGDVRVAGLPYPSPVEALLDRQEPDGRFSSPSDSWGVNTFATSQAVQGLVATEGPWPYESTGCTAGEPLGPRRVVNALYVDLLVRLADPAGADFWTDQFEAGVAPAQLAKRFTGTPEYGGRVVERLYQELLGRSATPAERQGWSPWITAGRRIAVTASILGSDEFYDGTTFEDDPTPATWAAAAYPLIVGRPASAGDIAYVEAQVEAERTLTAIANGLLRSTEGRGHMVKGIYRQLLRRDPSTADRAYWGGELGRGVSPERLVTLIAGSAEYRTNTNP